MLRLGYSLLTGVAISEFLLDSPLLCVPVYGLLLFHIYYNDTPSALPMAALFMTLGITMVPIMSFSGAGVAHMIAFLLLFNMGCGLLFAWLFHALFTLVALMVVEHFLRPRRWSIKKAMSRVFKMVQAS